jgi:hypothetical protein
MPFLRREGPLILTSLVAAIAIGEYYLQLPTVLTTASFMNRVGVILAAFFIGFGLVNLVTSHTRAITTRRPKWIFSIWLLLVTAITIVTGIIPPVTQHPTYQWIYTYIFSTLEPAVFSLIAFFIAAVAFRAFRIRNWESSIMMFFAVVMMLRNAPVGPALFPPVGTLGDWVLQVPAMANNRAVSLASSLGIIALGVRTLLGLERGYMGGED